MRVSFALLGIGLGLLGAGCSLVQNATCLMTNRVTEFCDDCSERRRNELWAEEAWAKVCKHSENRGYSEDYGEGFKTGFADFVYQGGDGEPPPLPPKSYRTLRYQTPQGYQAVQDWFAGFRHGAAAAREGGQRQWVTGPSSLPAPAPVFRTPRADTPAYPVVSPLPEVLPPPRTTSPSSKSESASRPTVTAVSAQTPARSDTGVCRIIFPTPEGGVLTTCMGVRSCHEMMKTILSKKQAHRNVGGQHTLLIIMGPDTESLEVDDATLVDVGALLKWYHETPQK